MKKTLYDMTSEFLALLDADELDTAQIEEHVQDIRQKLDGYAKVRAELKSESNKFKEEEARLNARRKTIESNIDRLELAMSQVMYALDVPKINTGMFKISLQDNPPSLVEIDGAVPPEEFLIPQPDKVDKSGIKAAIKLGRDIEGYEVKSTGKSLRVR